MLPLQTAFGWNVDVISSSAAVGIFLYGLAGPFAAAVMQRFGIRRTVLGALALMSASTGASYFMTVPWQLFLTWGIIDGCLHGMHLAARRLPGFGWIADILSHAKA
jgi:MFS family permease